MIARWVRRVAATRTARVAAAVAVALAVIRLWPHAPLRDRLPVSTTVWSSDGELLRVTLSTDDRYRVWQPLEQVAPVVREAFLLKEDRWFYWHPGVNPIALLRAAARTYRRNTRQGGSTLTMQYARLAYRLNTRTITGKGRQVALALWLEARYSKHDLLEAYLNLAPFGGNIEGVGAASLVYFGKTADRITLSEALTLAVIPQRPSGRAGRHASEAALLQARSRLGRLWLRAHGGRADDARQVELSVLPEPSFRMPSQAPHFVDAVLAANPAHPPLLATTLDARLQRLVESQIGNYLRTREQLGVANAAALLVDARDMSVKAWVGSADYWRIGDGQVNGVLARRSPGSALKPFVYALALDQGVLHPQTVLRDAPTAFGPFTPENFDGRFAGPVTAEEALIRSRNIPAVYVASQLHQPSLYQFLQSAGVRGLKSESFYGLALPLGGAEISMEEVATLYATLANGGAVRAVRTTQTAAASAGVRLLSAEASFITLDMLRHNPRPDDDGSTPTRVAWPVAWKTGTSWGFRDAWSAGVAGPYVLVIWIGNFDGQGNPAFVGVDAAAPLFFRIVDALNAARANEPISPALPPPGVSRVTVCVGSGDLPNAECPRTVDTWYIPGKSPIRVSQLHRTIAIDGATGEPTCPPYSATTRFESFEFWSSDMLTLFQKAGMPRRTPPRLPACATDDAADAPRIASPMRSVAYSLDPRGERDSIALEATVAGDVKRVYWFDGPSLIASRSVDDAPFSWRPAAAGIHLVRIVDDHGRADERDVDVDLRRR